jgi:glycosyltransferase involved in cell wall biosynthesis
MKISIITPTRNSSAFIEDNLRSIHLDNSGNDEFEVEQIIIDGGSTDQTLDIIHDFISKYSVRNIKIIEGRDRNMYDAINKGLGVISGDIWSVLNSDDYYLPNVLSTVINFFKDKDIYILFGNLLIYEQIKNKVKKQKLFNVNFKDLLAFGHCTLLPQPTAFLRKEIIDLVGFFDINYNYASDYDYFLRALSLKKIKVKHINTFVTVFRRSSDNLSTKYKYKLNKERLDIISKYSRNVGKFDLLLRKLYVWVKYLYYNNMLH